ncbi:MAG: cytochrome b [Desulfobacterales bacterium]|nr:cytochrome b [Desulfobacterales bacterium]
MMKDTKEKLSGLTVGLHWLVGLTTIVLLAVGMYMTKYEAGSLYPIHKSIGILIFSVILVRVGWRIKNGWPEPANNYKYIERLLSKLVQWVLIISTVVMPISGMFYSGAGGYGFGIFDLELFATNPDPVNPSNIIALNESVAKLGREIHWLVSRIMIAAVLLHVAGALKHHFVDKDGTLRRMLGGSNI